jgi:dinuclear metal center YbgI/SA1388 family protein
MTIGADILDMLNTAAPFNLAEDWDNSGFQAGNPGWEVKKIMVALDVSMPVMVDAVRTGCDLVVVHHPLMIKPENSIDFSKMPGSVIELAACHKTSIICVHTNLDKAENGLNDLFAEKIGLRHLKAFYLSSARCPDPENSIAGIGRAGLFRTPVALGQLAYDIKRQFGLDHVRITGDPDMLVHTAAVCTGSGGSLIDVFLNSEADVYITGDIKYHEARRVEECSKALVDVGHFASEHIAVDLIAEKLNSMACQAGLDIQITKYEKEKDPFTIV